MRPFIIIRKFEKRDDIPVQKVIQKYHKKLANVVFISCLFKEITLQICVLSWAILFIFMGIPLSVCFLSIPGTLVFILFAVYTTYYNKSVEMAMDSSKLCWVAELYEPLKLRSCKKEMEYTFFNEKDVIDNEDLNRMIKKIIGTISVKNHKSLVNSGWLNRLAIHPDYPFNVVACKLIDTALLHAHVNDLYTCETSVTEYEDSREAYIKVGFTIKQIYHKQSLLFKVMKAQLGINLNIWLERDKNYEADTIVEDYY